jgi:hypothetical protein
MKYNDIHWHAPKSLFISSREWYHGGYLQLNWGRGFDTRSVNNLLSIDEIKGYEPNVIFSECHVGP